MNSNLSELIFILDRSGSMATTAEQAVAGFNGFIADQKQVQGEANVFLAQFDHEYEVVHACVPINKVPQLTRETFVPRGMTALLDAIGRTIHLTGERLAALPEQERPAKVIVVIITDGGENASKDYSRETIAKMTAHQESKYSWEFVFIGANQDAVQTGQTIGIKASNSMSYAANAIGTQAAYEALSKNIRGFRDGSKVDMSFEPEDRTAQDKAGL